MTRLAAIPLALAAWLVLAWWALRRPSAPVGAGDPDEPTAVIDMSEVPPFELIPGGWTA